MKQADLIRRQIVCQLRTKGFTFEDIGRRICRTGVRAQQLYHKETARRRREFMCDGPSQIVRGIIDPDIVLRAWEEMNARLGDIG